ncbi:MAG: chromosome segregation protein SMC, partial [Christensenellaceae bacterium]|nr:chromosome segregation protein SMC [Christensenellaceae bacterium]
MASLLLRVTMEGFMSCPVRTTVDFTEMATCVVGENGAGKSSFMEAIKWVFGSKNSELRDGTKSADLLYRAPEGARRKNAAKALVVVTIDNRNNRFTTYYETNPDNGEITRDYRNKILAVSRLYEIDKGNQYRVFEVKEVNGQLEYPAEDSIEYKKSLVRSSEVLAIFAESGVGRDGYSFVPQQRVDELVAKDDSDSRIKRRKAFDNVANVAEAKDKIKAFNKVLADTEAEIKSKEPQCELLGDELKNAEKELEKLNRKKRLQEKQKFLSIKHFANKVEAFDGKLTKAQDSFNEADAGATESEVKLVELLTNKKNLEADERDIKGKKLENDAEISKLNDKRIKEEGFMQGAGSLGSYEQQIINLTAKHKKDTEWLINAEADVEYREGRVAVLEKNARDTKDAYDKALLAFSRAEDNYLTKVKAVDEASRLMEETGDSNAKISRSTQISKQINAFRIENADDTKKISDIEGEIQKTERDKAKKNGEYESAVHKAEGFQRQVDSNAAEIIKATEEKNKAIEDYGNYMTQARDARDKAQRVKNFKSGESSQNDENDTFSRIFANIKNDPEVSSLVVSPFRDLITTPNESLLDAIIQFLGPQYNAVILKRNQDVPQVKRFIQRGDYRSVTVRTFGADTVKERFVDDSMYSTLEEFDDFEGVASELVRIKDSRYQNVVNSLLGNLIVVKTDDGARDIGKATNFKHPIVSYDGLVFYAGGGGSFSTQKPQSKYKSVSSTLTESESSLLARAEGCEKAANEALKAKTNASNLLETLNSTKFSLQGKLVAANAEKQNAVDFINSNYNIPIAELSRKIEELKAAIGVRNEKIKDAEARLSMLPSSGGDTKTVAEIQQLAKQELVIAESASSTARNNKTTAKDAAEAAEIQNKENNAELSKMQTVISQTKKELIASEESIKEFTASYENIKVKSAQVAFTSEDKEKYEQLKAESDDYAAKLATIALSLVQLSIEIDEVKDKKNQFEKVREIARAQIERLNEDNSNTFGEVEKYDIISLADALTYLEEATPIVELEGYVYSLETIEEQLKSLENRIRNIGAVNETAETSYNARKESYEKEYNALVETKNVKEKTAAQKELIMSDAADKFKRQFEKIQVYFRSECERMLNKPGAKITSCGDIFLDEPLNPLYSDIIRKVKLNETELDIHRYSGGERALIANCLIFAMSDANPAPFVIFDESDAALDIEKVPRIGSYIMERSKNEQYIV